ncbi:hypothetical protein OTU49_012574 [Cherax quadricarinatus]|uniref:Uncharacterized protein n=3 Tax=Cherax quadricarinatus TaxID=27406 RepID=A0AAW0YK73_CHEQU
MLALVSTALTNSTDPHSLFSMKHFLGLLNVFQRDSVSAGDGVTRGVVEALLTHHPGDFTDPILVQHLLTLCGALHDSINALTTDDERRQLSQLIISFIRQVNFGRDFEQQLDFYVNARAAFSNLDTVLVSLVQCVCRLAMATWNVMHSQHSGKTASFVRACAAYCFITVPSLAYSTTRLKLYLLSGTVALINNCLGQVEGNDSLYGGDPKVQQEAEQLCTTLLHNILLHIQSLTGIHEKRCGPLAFSLFWCIVTWCDLTQPQMMKVTSQIWSLVLKHCHPETVVQARDWISRHSVHQKHTSLAQLVRHGQA